MIKSWMFKPQETGGLPLTGWTYRKSVTLSRASGAVTNYQMKLLVGESSGATGEDVDCAGHCLSSFNDIRFTTSDGTTLLDYWIESISGATPNQLAVIWIEFNSISTSATTFYLYYGNAGAAAYSNGANTFITFDDFERGSDGDTVGGAWTEINAHCHISTEQKYAGTRGLKLIGAAALQARCSIPQTHADSIYAFRMRIYKEDATEFYYFHGDETKFVFVRVDTSENILFNNGTYQDTGANCAADSWYSMEIRNINFTAGTYDIVYNDTVIQSAAGMYTGTTETDWIRLAVANVAGPDVWFDNFIVRNWRSTEPAWGAWGAEES